MLIMHEWLFENVHDDDYWPEYVNLCIACGRTTIVGNVNALIPVACAGLNYPEDTPCTTEHIVSFKGTLKQTPQSPYILTVEPTQIRPDIWQSTDEMGSLITTLHNSFKEYGVPKVLEVTAPAKEVSFSDEKFYTCCSLLEKKMKKHSPMKVAIVNGAGNQKSKPVSYICSIEDIIKLKAQLRERKIHLQLSIDFPALLSSKRNTTYNHNEILGALTEIKNSIVCLHISSVKPQTRDYAKSVTLNNDTDTYFINKYKYPVYDDFYTVLSAIFNDNQKRLFIPKNVSSDAELEGLIDNMLRSGFAFCGGGLQNE